MPAVIAGFIPSPVPIVMKATPIVAVAVQLEPQAIPTIAQSKHPIGKNVCGVSSTSP